MVLSQRNRFHGTLASKACSVLLIDQAPLRPVALRTARDGVHVQQHDCNSCQLFELGAQDWDPEIATLGHRRTDDTQFSAHTLITLHMRYTHKMKVLHWIFGTCPMYMYRYISRCINVSK